MPISNLKTGQTVHVSLDTLPAQAIEPEPLPTQGIEVELPLRQAQTFEPALAETIIALFGQVDWRSAEPPAHCCELKTEPHQHAAALLAQYRERAAWLCRWADAHGLLVVPIAAEPLAGRCEVSSYGFIRQVAERKYGIAAMEMCHGLCTQLNTHIADGDALLVVYRAMVRIAPVLVAMFASSPFAAGRCAGGLAYRHVVRRALLNGGDPEFLPPSVRWQEYIQSHHALTDMGVWFPTAFAANGMIRVRPDRMCVENGVTDLIAEPRHLMGLIELNRRVVYRILCAYRDGEPLPPWFGPDSPAVQDAAFRASLLSAAQKGSQGMYFTTELRATPIQEVFAKLLMWAGEAGVPVDPSLPWADADVGLRDLLEHGSPAERLIRAFRELHPDCQNTFAGCPGCPAAVAEVSRRYGEKFHAQLTADSTPAPAV